jgi:hypothetical protein
MLLGAHALMIKALPLHELWFIMGELTGLREMTFEQPTYVAVRFQLVSDVTAKESMAR